MTTSPASQPASQSDARPHARPAPLVVAASLALVEGVGLLLLAGLELASIDSDRISLGISTGVFFALVGAGVLGCSAALLRLAPWSRGPLLLTQLIALGLAWNLKELWVVAGLLVVAGLVALAGLVHPDTTRALGVPTGGADEA